MRSMLKAMLDRRVSLIRDTPTKGSSGSDVHSWANVTTNKRAAIWPNSAAGDIAEAFARRDIVVSHAICLFEDISARRGDRISEYGSESTGPYYVVEDVMNFENSWVFAHPIYVIGANLRTV